jgi:hypothetical protein
LLAGSWGFGVQGNMGVGIDQIHLRPLGSEVVPVTLYDTKRIDPEVTYSQLSADLDGVTDRLR